MAITTSTAMMTMPRRFSGATPPPNPLPETERGSRSGVCVLLPLSVSGRGLGGGVRGMESRLVAARGGGRGTGGRCTVQVGVEARRRGAVGGRDEHDLPERSVRGTAGGAVEAADNDNGDPDGGGRPNARRAGNGLGNAIRRSPIPTRLPGGSVKILE